MIFRINKFIKRKWFKDNVSYKFAKIFNYIIGKFDLKSKIHWDLVSYICLKATRKVSETTLVVGDKEKDKSAAFKTKFLLSSTVVVEFDEGALNWA